MGEFAVKAELVSIIYNANQPLSQLTHSPSNEQPTQPL